MSGADDIRDGLRRAVDNALYGRTEAIQQVARARGTYLKADDLLDLMRACPDLILSLEAMQDAVKHAEASIRQALAVAMADSGATTVLSTGHSTSLRDSARVVRVTDERLVPSEFMRCPAPAPDKVAIARELRAGRAVQGCELSNGGPATISIRSRT